MSDYKQFFVHFSAANIINYFSEPTTVTIRFSERDGGSRIVVCWQSPVIL